MRTVAVRLVALALGVVVGVLIAEVGIRFVAPQPLQHIQLDDQLYFVNRPFARFLYAKEDEYSVDVAYNAWGFRGPIPDPSPAPGVTRILLIGDSQTEGLQVRYDVRSGAPAASGASSARPTFRGHQPGGLGVRNAPRGAHASALRCARAALLDSTRVLSG